MIGRILLSILFVVLFILIIVFLIVFLIKRKRWYVQFVLDHSIAIHRLDDINNRYKFKCVSNNIFENSYDNERYYDLISCKDYLTYELVYCKNDVLNAIDDAFYNKKIFERYTDEINKRCKLNDFDISRLPLNKKLLIKIENKLFNKRIQKPTLEFSIFVKITLTNINGYYIKSKKAVFSVKEITSIVNELKRKRGDRYLSYDIWKSISNVERAKVTNRLRFAIYKRDNYRCKKCGSTENLEIDHIVPISRGGKSTYSNLQTLCHKCNKEKGSKIEIF